MDLGRSRHRGIGVNLADTAVHLVLGLGPGAVYGALGLGLVLTYRGTGVVNLAYGAMAMYPTYVFSELRHAGNLVLPGIPGTLHLADDVATVPALVVTMLVAAVLGLGTYVVVARPLHRAPPLAGVVAAVGVMIVLQSVVTLRFGTDPRTVAPVLPSHGLAIAGRTVPADRLYLVGLLLVLLTATTVVFRRTRFGLASRAATESAVDVELLGRSAMQLGAVNWTLGAMLAALFGVLLAPIAGLSPSGYPLLVVPALVAALAGRLVSPAIGVISGLALGVFQAQATRVRLDVGWLGPQTIRTVVPFVALVGVVMLRGTPTPPRDARPAARLPPTPASAHTLGVTLGVLVVGAAATIALQGAYRAALAVTVIAAILCLSLVVLTGLTGQISLAQTSFAGVAGFVLSGVTSRWDVPFPIGPVAGVLAAAALGLVVGLPAIRARGMTLAILTFGAALAVEELVFRNLSGGFVATNAVAPAQVFGLDLAAVSSRGTPRVAFGLFVVTVLTGLAWAVMHLRSSPLGRRMLALRSNERAAAASGVDIARTKVQAFVLSAMIAGIAGTLAGYQHGALSDQSFSTSRSLVVLAVAYLGGIGSVPGAVLGGLVIPGGLVSTAADRLLHLGRYDTLFAGVAVVVAVLRHPEGVASALRRLREP